MDLAIFDLDNTLLIDDSDHLWGQFLVDQGLVDGEFYGRENHRFYEEYKQGTLDIYEFLRFSFKPLRDHDKAILEHKRVQFIEEIIRPIIPQASQELIAHHRRQQHFCLIITATNRFVTEPIAKLLGVDDLLATDPAMVDGRYTGDVEGIPCFQEGKVKRLHAWLRANGLNLANSWFYSDSHNDLPLLEEVTHPVAVDPDDTLKQHAEFKGWPIISLRGPALPEHIG